MFAYSQDHSHKNQTTMKNKKKAQETITLY